MNLRLKHFFNLLITAITISLISGFFPNAIAAESSKNALSMLVEQDAADDFLKPDDAFKLKLSALNTNNIQADFTVASGYYLYKQRIKFEIQAPNTGKIIEISLPAGEIKDDVNFGKQEVYHQDLKAKINVADVINNSITIAASYQGCSEKGLCYAPIKKNITVNLNEITADTALINTNSADDDSTHLLKSGNIWLIIAGFFGAGLLLSLTPCVLPMIPILSSIIVGSQNQSGHHSKLHNFGLSVAYVLGMSLSYTLAGITAGLSGSLISQSLQNPWVLGSSALIFVLLALSMFDIYELKLPSTLEDKLVNTSNKLKGGRFLGVFVMGVLSALIVSPCVAAPLAGALIYIGQSQNVVLGGTALFALSIGMGMPLLLIGVAGSHVLPKVGNWMNAVRNFFGVLMLAMAIWLISPVIPISVQLALWATLLIVNAVYLNALDNLPAHANNVTKLWKGVAVIMLILGIALLIGALSGAKSALQPLSGLNAKASSNQKLASSLPFTRVSSIAELDKKITESKGQPVMLDFYADWCVSCKELELLTFSDEKVQQLLKNTTLLQLDVTANTEEDKALLKRYSLFGPPGIVFFNGHGQEMTSLKTVGFQNADQFSATLAKRDSCMIKTPASNTPTIQC